jgi:2-polyprenyl-3-methyl-5-hydroxy-6-metoxy-1,4-benzoquinol methylase
MARSEHRAARRDVRIEECCTMEYGYEDAELCCDSAYILPVLESALRELPPNSIVADLGCGNGSKLARFRQRGWQLHGLDFSPSGIAQATQAFAGIRFEQTDLTADLCNHPLAGRCDVVISTEVIEHIFLPRIYARNCYEFLKPGGMLLLSTPYHGYLKNLALALAGKMDFHYTALWDYGHIKFWSRHTITTLLEESGFVVRRFQGAGRAPYLWNSMIVRAQKLSGQQR